MTTVLVAPTERDLPNMLDSSIVSSIPEEYGADILSFVREKKGTTLTVAIQRKEVPADFNASITDGRIGKEAVLLRRADIRILFLEGRMSFDSNGCLMVGQFPCRITREGVDNLLLSLQVTHGIAIENTDNTQHTADRIRSIIKWCSEGTHVSLLRRAGPEQKEYWLRQSAMSYFIQGIPGVGYIQAQNIAKVATTPRKVAALSEDDLKDIPLIGKKRTKKIIHFLDTGEV